MSERLYPEAIRGAWFIPTDERDPAEALRSKQFELLNFKLDGSFTQHTAKGGALRQSAHGSYTFDGDFLITRARTTETYRVQTPSLHSWVIETLRGPTPMLRTLEPDCALSPDEARDLRILPIRARATPIIEGVESALRLAREGDEQRALAIISVERQPTQHTCWIGILRLAAGLDEKTWLRIAQESIFDLYMQDTDAIQHIHVQLIDAPEYMLHTLTR